MPFPPDAKEVIRSLHSLRQKHCDVDFIRDHLGWFRESNAYIAALPPSHFVCISMWLNTGWYGTLQNYARRGGIVQTMDPHAEKIEKQRLDEAEEVMSSHSFYDPLRQWPEKRSALMARITKTVGEIIDGAPPLPSELIVYKGIAQNTFRLFRRDPSTGVLRTDMFAATSLSSEVAAKFADRRGRVVTIHLAPGSRVLWVQSISDDPKEFEILLQRHTAFQETIGTPKSGAARRVAVWRTIS